MTLEGELSGLATRDIRERNGEWQLVQGLNEDRFNAICVLLRGQSATDLQAFKTAVEQLVGRGYQLTSLVADLRCPSGADLPRTWKCEVRAKIGAKARKAAR